MEPGEKLKREDGTWDAKKKQGDNGAWSKRWRKTTYRNT